MKKLIVGYLVVVLTSGCSLFGRGSEEQPNYQVIIKDENKEIRKYDSYIIAKTVIKGSFKEAQSKGFKILAGYIFGKNNSNQNISMTAPVVQKEQSESEKISMTAPVVIAADQTDNGGVNQSWVMTFSMPAEFTLETLPIPNDDRIIIEKVEERLVAAFRFSGFWNETKIAEKGDELKKWLEGQKSYELKSKPMFAGYNPPWTLPFFRRNEVLIDLQVETLTEK